MTPVIQKMRQVPFSIKDDVTPKINDLPAYDITERVEGSGRGHTKANRGNSLMYRHEKSQ